MMMVQLISIGIRKLLSEMECRGLQGTETRVQQQHYYYYCVKLKPLCWHSFLSQELSAFTKKSQATIEKLCRDFRLDCTQQYSYMPRV